MCVAAQTIADSGANELNKSSLSASFYRPELDCVRLLAFLAVFFQHSSSFRADSPPLIASVIIAGQRSGGYGVDLFLVLSSYCTELLLREHRVAGKARYPLFGSGAFSGFSRCAFVFLALSVLLSDLNVLNQHFLTSYILAFILRQLGMCL